MKKILLSIMAILSTMIINESWAAQPNEVQVTCSGNKGYRRTYDETGTYVVLQEKFSSCSNNTVSGNKEQEVITTKNGNVTTTETYTGCNAQMCSNLTTRVSNGVTTNYTCSNGTCRATSASKTSSGVSVPYSCSNGTCSSKSFQEPGNFCGYCTWESITYTCKTGECYISKVEVTVDDWEGEVDEVWCDTRQSCATTASYYGIPAKISTPSFSSPNVPSRTSVTCPANCGTCNAAGTCVVCQTGSTMTNGVCSAACPANCTSCDGEVCTACNNDHLLKDGNCSTSTTQGCGNGMYANGNVCTQCDSSCATCSAGGSCDTCAGNLLLQGGNCVETCSGGYYQDGSSCQQCDSNCATCSASGSCDTCSGNYAKQGSSCVETCDDGYYKDGNTCQTCDSSCATCSTSSSCDICAEGLIKQGNSCVSNCDSGYYKGGNNTCEACGENCDSCYSSASCSTCKSNYLEKNGKCISASQGCGDGYKNMGGWCNRVIYTPVEAAGLLNEGNNNIVTITFKK